ncbi:MAG TPA: ATP-binding protein [Blastocatellia bacterium]|nr:ATP-binding protein [Blastocatellia bacterium]
MRRFSNPRLILFFVALTILLTLVVVFMWEQLMMTRLYGWFESNYPGRASADYRWRMAQRVEHFFISIVVDTVVVFLLLRVVDRQQRRLQESEERYRAIFEHANDGVGVVAAADHRLVDANKMFAELLGASTQSLIGRKIGDLLKQEDGSEADWLADMLMQSKTDSGGPSAEKWSGEREVTIRVPSGRALAVSASCSVLSAGKQRLCILILRDLTEFKRHERERQEMQRQLFQTSKLASIGELSAGVAHEINNPLNAIVNFAQLLKDDGVARNESEAMMIQGIIDEGGRIARIVRDLLTFARTDPPQPTRVDLRQCVEKSISLFGHQLEKDGISVEVNAPADVFPVLADASRLRQVVVNLISNAHHALRAKPDHPKSFILSISNGERAKLPVVRMDFYDNGIGIKQENIDKVFDPFFTTRRDSGGTGLGLSLSFGIIQNYGGTIKVESQEGSYTKFTVELPAETGAGTDYAKSVSGGR